MADATHTTGSIARLVGAELVGPGDLPIRAVDNLERAGPDAITYLRNAAFANKWAGARAGAAVVTRGVKVPGHDPSGRALLIVVDADLALAALLELFSTPQQMPAPGVHPTAVIDASASIDPAASIGPLCTIGARTRIGPGAVLVARVHLGADVVVGPGSVLHPGVVVYDRCVLGASNILHANAVIGADGFGYRPAPDRRGYVKIPHLGDVRIGDGVEIGAGACIDRAKFGSTSIGDGTKIDNLCQIGHNCTIGRAVIICGMCGIAGSVTIGDGAMLAGAVGIADNLSVGAGARIAARSAVMTNIPPGETWFGHPAKPRREAARLQAALKKLADHLDVAPLDRNPLPGKPQD